MEKIPWHPIVQELFDNKLSFMSGKTVTEGEREWNAHIKVDYFCRVEPEKPYSGEITSGVKTFDHLGPANLIEYKSMWEGLNLLTFWYYLSRANVVAYFEKEAGRRAHTTLTILTTGRPRLLDNPLFGFTELFPWKFKSKWHPYVDVYIIVQQATRGIQMGEALAYLQILEGKKAHQEACWQNALDQNLSNTDDLKRIMIKINKEVFMNLIEEFKKEGREEGREAVALNLLEEGLDVTLILRVSGLTAEALEELRARHDKGNS